MKWFRKKKEAPQIQVSHYPIEGLVRKAIYDTMLTPSEGIAELLGLSPISTEVAEMEERASEERLEKIGALIPFIDSHAGIAAQIAVAAYVLENEDAVDTDEDIEKMTGLFKVIALSSAISSISALVDIGLIESEILDHE